MQTLNVETVEDIREQLEQIFELEEFPDELKEELLAIHMETLTMRILIKIAPEIGDDAFEKLTNLLEQSPGAFTREFSQLTPHVTPLIEEAFIDYLADHDISLAEIRSERNS